jgi:hypothetical protein
VIVIIVVNSSELYSIVVGTTQFVFTSLVVSDSSLLVYVAKLKDATQTIEYTLSVL